MIKNIIILHGWTMTVNLHWFKLVEKLKKAGFKVYFPKVPGLTGEKLLNSWSLADFSRWLGRYIDENRISDYILLGHSFGGSIVLKYALEQRPQLKAIILINSAGIRRQTRKKKWIGWIVKRLVKAKLMQTGSFKKSRWRSYFYKLIGSTDYLKTNGYTTLTFRQIIEEDLSAYFHKIKIPALLLWGEMDKDTPLRDGKIMHDGISRSKLIIFRDATHGLPFQRPENLTAAISAFCQGLS